MSCLLAIIIPTELTTFMAQAPTSDTEDDFFWFSVSIFFLCEGRSGGRSRADFFMLLFNRVRHKYKIQNLKRREKLAEEATGTPRLGLFRTTHAFSPSFLTACVVCVPCSLHRYIRMPQLYLFNLIIIPSPPPVFPLALCVNNLQIFLFFRFYSAFGIVYFTLNVNFHLRF